MLSLYCESLVMVIASVVPDYHLGIVIGAGIQVHTENYKNDFKGLMFNDIWSDKPKLSGEFILENIFEVDIHRSNWMDLSVISSMTIIQGRAAEAINDGSGELVPVAAFVDEEHRTRTGGSQVYDREKKPIRIGRPLKIGGLVRSHRPHGPRDGPAIIYRLVFFMVIKANEEIVPWIRRYIAIKAKNANHK
ncbi:hypothetical protein SASPL_107950 [Salvia splendens]|uniref:Uncharacterized protein n=1 Tax=Salvia splendens TaxID=180675 RepID=A0A8X8YEE4_SALSN|nr:hypothetical protein SASPL_107950 [Salvia splendens]